MTQIGSWGLLHTPPATSGVLRAVGCSDGCISSPVVLEFVMYLNKTRDHLEPPLSNEPRPAFGMQIGMCRRGEGKKMTPSRDGLLNVPCQSH